MKKHHIFANESRPTTKSKKVVLSYTVITKKGAFFTRLKHIMKIFVKINFVLLSNFQKKK